MNFLVIMIAKFIENLIVNSINFYRLIFSLIFLQKRNIYRLYLFVINIIKNYYFTIFKFSFHFHCIYYKIKKIYHYKKYSADF